MGIRTGLGILIGVFPILLFIFHPPFRDFTFEIVDSVIAGLRNVIG